VLPKTSGSPQKKELGPSPEEYLALRTRPFNSPVQNTWWDAPIPKPNETIMTFPSASPLHHHKIWLSSAVYSATHEEEMFVGPRPGSWLPLQLNIQPSLRKAFYSTPFRGI
jgi:hypothetical protein